MTFFLELIICPYQILSNYLKQYGSYGRHKISVTEEKEMRVVSLANDTSCGPYQILSKYFKPLRGYGGLEIRSRAITRENNKARVVLLACNTPT